MENYFSTNLKFLREQKGLSQNKLAQKIGVNQTTIARWEDDNRVPNIDNAVDVAEALNIELPDLLGRDLRLNEKVETKKFNIGDVEIKLYKNGDISNDDLDEAMQFILEQKIKNKKNNN